MLLLKNRQHSLNNSIEIILSRWIQGWKRSKECRQLGKMITPSPTDKISCVSLILWMIAPSQIKKHSTNVCSCTNSSLQKLLFEAKVNPDRLSGSIKRSFFRLCHITRLIFDGKDCEIFRVLLAYRPLGVCVITKRLSFLYFSRQFAANKILAKIRHSQWYGVSLFYVKYNFFFLKCQ